MILFHNQFDSSNNTMTMNAIVFVFVLALAGQFVAGLEIVKTTPMSDSTNFPYIPYAAFATSGPYIVTAGLYKNTSDWELNIQKRNASGYYAEIAKLEPISPSVSVTTNGKWFAAAFFNNGTAVVFQLVNDVISNISYIDEPQNSYIKVLSDDSLLFISNGNVTTYTYSSDGHWSQVDRSALKNFVMISYLGLVHITDTTLAYVGSDNMGYLYIRSDRDKSWQLRYSIWLNTTDATYNIAWNGADTVIVSAIDTSGSNTGAVSLYELSGNTWNFMHNFTVEDLGVKPLGYLGMNMEVLDNDTFIIGAPLDGITASYVGGSAFILQRKSGSWSVPIRLESSERDIYGLGLGFNDVDILLYSCEVVSPGTEAYCRSHVLTRCFNAPINVTCKDVKIDTCKSLDSVDFSTLYTINNPLCGQVDVHVKSLSADATTIELSLEFSRSFTESVSCKAQATCSNLEVSVVSGSGQRLVNVVLVLFLILKLSFI